jgi:hypothetical protein
MRSVAWLYLAGIVGLSSCAHKISEPLPEESKIQEPSEIDPARPPRVRIEGLKENALVNVGESITVKVYAENYPLGPSWQAVEVVLNDQPPVRIFENGHEVTFREGFRKGGNVVRAYLVRSWGESLKLPDAFAALPFFYEEAAGLPLVAKGRPILTLVSPYGHFKGDAAKQILFDFLVWDGDSVKPRKIHYTLNGKKLELNSGKAYHFFNLAPGDYDLLVELVNARGLPYGQEVTRGRAHFVVGDGGKPKK